MEKHIEKVRLVINNKVSDELILKLLHKTKSAEKTIDIILDNRIKEVLEQLPTVVDLISEDETPNSSSKKTFLDCEDVVSTKLTKKFDQTTAQFVDDPIQSPSVTDISHASKTKNLSNKENKKENLEKSIRSANKVVQDKKVAVSEMIVEIDHTLDPHIINECMQHLNEHGIDVLVKALELPWTVKWKRKCSKAWDINRQMFMPVEKMYIYEEKISLKIISATSLASIIKGGSLENDVNMLKSAYPDKKTIYLIYGMHDYCANIKRMMNESFKKGSSICTLPPSKSEIETYLLEIQILHNCHVILSNRDESIQDWILMYTREIAIGPYEKCRVENNMSFAISDMGACGKTKAENWRKMLEQLNMITPPIADMIVQQYPTYNSLWERLGNLSEREAMSLLENLEITNQSSQNVRRLGPYLADKMYKLMTSSDPNLLIN